MFLDVFFPTVFSLLFPLVFVLVVGSFLAVIIRGVRTWSRNNASPRLTVSAQVVTKRSHVSRHHSQHGAPRSRTSYYVTFQVESGDRLELPLSGPAYGMLAEGDRGSLTFQGTRYLGFQRE
ncbi:MAG: DUF2500 domain-containing protein [Oscillibacter sp.]|nr:DUF2500 domain-containing protein [Oscillibacter sp.]